MISIVKYYQNMQVILAQLNKLVNMVNNGWVLGGS